MKIIIDETQYESLSEEQVHPEDVSLSSFKVKKELNGKFWPNGKLNSRVRLRLMDIADDFMKDLSMDWVKPEDVLFTGSLANYNWSRFSDVDIHILIDFKKVYQKNTDFVEDYFKSKKENWASSHEDLKIFGFPIEISVEDTNEENNSSGRYSLYKNKWVAGPDDFQDAEISQDYVKNHAASIMTKIDSIGDKLETETDTHKCESYGNKAYRIFEKLKKMRAEGLESEKREMSSGNIIYKIIRRTGYLDKIWNIINSSYDKSNSIKESAIRTIPFDCNHLNESSDDGGSVSAGIIPFRNGKDGNTEVFLGFPGQPDTKDFDPPRWMDRWQILKGHSKTDSEDPIKCAVREFCEESGISRKKIDADSLIDLGSEKMEDGRKLVCFALDMTDDDSFETSKLHSNLIDDEKYIKINKGKPYPEIDNYKWIDIKDVKYAKPYEKAFYEKCDEIRKSRYSETGKDK